MKKFLISGIVLALTLSGCGGASRGSFDYDSTTGSYAAGQQSGYLLLTLNPNKNYSKAWVEQQSGKITYSPNSISMAHQPAFTICSEAAQTAYPEWSTSKHDEYIDYLAGCLTALGWTEDDHSLQDIAAS